MTLRLLLVICFAATAVFAQTRDDKVRQLEGELRQLREAQRAQDRKLEAAQNSTNAKVAEIEKRSTQVEGSTQSLDKIIRDTGLKQYNDNITRNLDRFWLLIAAVLVFFMQAGFKCLEVGMVRRQHGSSTAMKNLLDWMVLSAVFFLFGFGVVYGQS